MRGPSRLLPQRLLSGWPLPTPEPSQPCPGPSGLCGNFNGLEGDDFKTAGGLVEATGAGFANTWKAQSSCHDKVDWLDDPCSLNIESGEARPPGGASRRDMVAGGVCRRQGLRIPLLLSAPRWLWCHSGRLPSDTAEGPGLLIHRSAVALIQGLSWGLHGTPSAHHAPPPATSRVVERGRGGSPRLPRGHRPVPTCPGGRGLGPMCRAAGHRGLRGRAGAALRTQVLPLSSQLRGALVLPVEEDGDPVWQVPLRRGPSRVLQGGWGALCAQPDPLPRGAVGDC